MYLKRHIMTVHESHRYVKCDFCDKVFLKPCLLKTHITNVHEQIKNFKCEQCSMEFTQKSNLTKHQRTVHEGIKNYHCDLCKKSFFGRYQFEKHLTTNGHKEVIKQSNESENGALVKTESNNSNHNVEIVKNFEIDLQRS